MKLSRSKVLIVLLVLGLILVYANLLLTYANQKREQNSLRDQVNNSITTLKLLPAAPTDLPERLAAAQQAYDTALTEVSATDIDSTQIMEQLIKTAEIFNLKVNPATTNQWMLKNYGLTTYRVLPFSLEIKGSHEEIISYLMQLEDRTQFPFLAIDGLTLVGLPQNTDNSENDEQMGTLNANIVVRKISGD
jgi:hypothetical protein